MKRTLPFTWLFMLLLSATLHGQGAADALNFNGSSNSITLANPLNIGNSAHTVEVWVKIPLPGTNGLGTSERVGNILGAYNSSPHFNYEIFSTGAPRIYWNGGQVNSTAPSTYDLRDNNWHHLAFVRDTTNNQFLIYVDGIVANSTTSAGSDLTMTAAHKIGADNRGGGSPHFHGNMDEIRIWNTALSASEIRENMCKVADTSNANLLHYYNFNNLSGTTFPDLKGSNNGTLVGFSATPNIVSGAPVGDTSVTAYGNLASQTLTVSSTAKGTFSIGNITNNAAGIHLYRIDAVPALINGLDVLGTNDTYFGVFIAHDTNASYDATYNYSNYTLAQANEDSLKVYMRATNSDTLWSNSQFTRNKPADEMSKTALTNIQNQFMIGNFVGYVCQTPTNLDTTNVTFNSATINWQTGGATVWDIEFDSTGFTPGTGNLVTGVTTNPHTLLQLTPATTYDFYVRDNCGTLGASNWTGPFTFTTDPAPACANPTFQLDTVLSLSATFTLNSNSGNTNIQYGNAGFILGNGSTTIGITDTFFTINNLLPSTMYDVYVQDTCNQLNASSWVGPISFTTPAGFLPSYQNALHFDGVDDYIQTTNALPIGDTSHTVEAWIRIPKVGTENLSTGERAGILLGSYGATTNFNYEFYSTGAPRVWWNAGEINNTAASTYDLRDNKWHHVAFTRDEVADEFRIYIDGILIHTISGAGTDITMTSPHRIGGDNRATNGGPSFHGDVDELRIWNVARTTQEIRESMCKYADTSNADLLHYYPLNQHANDVANQNNGTLTNFTTPSWIISGAALGNKSNTMYNSNWSGASLTLNTTNRGNLTVDSIVGSAHGVHIYRIDTTPNSTSGIIDMGTQNVYYGVFLAEEFGTSPTAFNAEYDFSNYPDAVAASANVNLYNRSKANLFNWTNASANRNTAANTIKLTSSISSKEIILADFAASPCAAPTSVAVSNITPFTADVNWTSTQPAQYIQYGATGFALGNGTTVTNATSTYTINNLNYLTTYDLYVGDTCSATSSIIWTGPISFTTQDPCPSIDSVALDFVTGNSATFNVYPANLNTDMQVQWGPAGFTFGLGIITNLNGNPLDLLNLLSNSEYDAYFRVDCDTIFSDWYGPVSFKTDTTGGFSISENDLAKSLNVYPNPSNGNFAIHLQTSSELTLSIQDISGRVLHTEKINGNYTRTFTHGNFAKGLYFIRVSNHQIQATKKLIIN